VDHRTVRRNPDNLLLKMDGFKTTLLQLQTALFKELALPERYSFFFYLRISDKRKRHDDQQKYQDHQDNCDCF